MTENFYNIIFVTILLFSIIIPLYLSGRVWFAFGPFAINYYSTEKRSWYNSWNNDRFLLVLFFTVSSIILSIFWGFKILASILLQKINFFEIISYFVLHFVCFFLLEKKMDHPFKPLLAFKEFQKNKYDEHFIFNEKPSIDKTIDIHSTEIKKEISINKEFIAEEIRKHTSIAIETNEFARENNRLLQYSDFPFEIRNTANIFIEDVMAEFFISHKSENALLDFLLRKKKTEKIIFEKLASNGVSVKPILDFFSKYTNLMELCKEKKSLTQADVVKIINEIAIAKDRNGTFPESPIDSKNLSRYLSRHFFGEAGGSILNV